MRIALIAAAVSCAAALAETPFGPPSFGPPSPRWRMLPQPMPSIPALSPAPVVTSVSVICSSLSPMTRVQVSPSFIPGALRETEEKLQGGA